jgi:hypothetical protein
MVGVHMVVAVSKTLTVTESALIQAIILAVNQTFRYTEAEALARFEAELLAADVLRLLLEETGQTERAASLGTIGGLAQLLSSHTSGLSS